MTLRRIGPFIAGILLSGLLILIFWLVFAVPQQNRAASHEDERAAAVAANDQLETQKQDLIAKRANLNEIRADVKTLTDAFPVGASQKDIFDAILGAAAETGVTITTLSPSATVAGVPHAGETPEEEMARLEAEALAQSEATAAGTEVEAVTDPTKAVATMALTIEATGSPEGLRDFTRALESLKRPLTITTYQLAISDQRTALTITANSFFIAALADPDEVEGETDAEGKEAASPAPETPAASAPAVPEDQPQDGAETATEADTTEDETAEGDGQ